MAQARICQISLIMNPFQLSIENIGPLELRPWTLTTQIAIEALGEAQLTDAEQAIAMAWIQSREPSVVREALNSKTAIPQIREFAENFPLALLKDIGEWCKRQVELISASRVEMVQRYEPDPKQPKNL